MKKNSGLIIAIILVLVIAGIAIWYFYFRNPTGAKIGEEVIITPTPTPGPLDQFVCPAGTTGTYPDCTLIATTPDAIFANGLIAAKAKVTNSTNLNATQKVNAINMIDVFVPKDKDAILAEVASGKDLVTQILLSAEKYYLQNFGTPIPLVSNISGAGGRG